MSRNTFLTIADVLLFMVLALAVFSLHADPTHTANAGNAKVTVWSDKCSIPEIVNLPLRATWEENGKTVEGCFGMSPFGLLVFYFADRTAFAMPPDYFRRVVGA